MRRVDVRDDSGAVLLLALIFVLVVGLAGGALLTLSGSSLAQTSALGADRSATYAAESAIEVAIAHLREDTALKNTPGYSTDGSAPVACPDTTVSIPGYDSSIIVKCGVGSGTTHQFQRQIIFAACTTSSDCLDTSGAFDPQPGSAAIVVATTTFTDLATFSNGSSCVGLNAQNCFVPGTAVDVDAWDLTQTN